MSTPTRPSWRNWSGTVRCAPAHLRRPRDESEIAELVGSARERDMTVRAAGTGHSFNPLACTDGLLLDLTGYRGIVDVDRDAGSVTVKAGTTLWELSSALHREGLALANIGSLAEQSIAGAVSTGNHGSGIAHPPLAGEILALRLVTADGAVRTLAAGDGETFASARTALGALGVITSVTLRCVPRFNMRAVERGAALDDVLDGFEDWTAERRPRRDDVAALERRRRAALAGCHAGRAHARGVAAPVRDDLGRGALRRDRPSRPAAPRGRARAHRSSQPAGRAARGIRRREPPRLHLPPARALPRDGARAGARAGRPPRCASCAARCGARAATRRTRSSCVSARATTRRSARRTGARRATSTSPSRGRPATPRSSARSSTSCASTAAARTGPRRTPRPPRCSAPRYPAWDAFQRVRRALDPSGLFANDYVKRVLGPSLAAHDAERGRTTMPAGV